MNRISNEVNQRLDGFFPEPLDHQPEVSEMEKKVEGYVNKFLLKGCEWWEAAARITNTSRNIYKAIWIPYYMLKRPMAFRKLLHHASAEKNLETLSNVTSANAHRSVISPGVARAVPYFFCSPGTALAASKYLSGTSLLIPFVYRPAHTVWSHVWNGSDGKGGGWKALDGTQMLNDFAKGCEKACEVYQGPDALVGATASLTLAIVMGVISYSAWYVLLNDGALKERYQTLDKLYTDVAMLLKSRWDQAAKDGNKDAMKQCVEQVTKLSTNIELITSKLTWEASLTEAQTKDIKLKLSWGINYVLKQDELIHKNETKAEQDKAIEPKTAEIQNPSLNQDQPIPENRPMPEQDKATESKTAEIQDPPLNPDQPIPESGPMPEQDKAPEPIATGIESPVKNEGLVYRILSAVLRRDMNKGMREMKL